MATSLAPASGFLLDMDPIKVSQEPDKLKHKSKPRPRVFTTRTFYNFFLVWPLLDVYNKVELGKAQLEVPEVSSKLQWGWSQYDFALHFAACVR